MSRDLMIPPGWTQMLVRKTMRKEKSPTPGIRMPVRESMRKEKMRTPVLRHLVDRPTYPGRSLRPESLQGHSRRRCAPLGQRPIAIRTVRQA